MSDVEDMEYPEIQKYRRDILNKIRDPQASLSLRAVLCEHFMDVLAQTSYDVNQLWSERAELFVVLDDIDEIENPPELITLFKKWYQFVDQQLETRMGILGETPDIFDRIQDTLDDWGREES